MGKRKGKEKHGGDGRRGEKGGAEKRMGEKGKKKTKKTENLKKEKWGFLNISVFFNGFNTGIRKFPSILFI